MKLLQAFVFIVIAYNSVHSASMGELDSTHIDSNLSGLLNTHTIKLNRLDSSFHEIESLKAMAEHDIKYAQNLVNVMETIVEFIALLIAAFSIVGVFQMRKINQTRSRLTRALEEVEFEREKLTSRFAELKEAFVKEGRDLLHILFYITEGDNSFEADRTEEAIGWYKQAIKIRNDNPDVYTKLGYVFVKTGKYDKAIAYLKEGYDISPGSISILNGLGRAYRKAHRFEEAIAYYEEAIRLDPEYIWSLSGLGQALLHTEQYERAIEVFQRVLIKDATSLPNINMALAYSCIGDRIRRKEYFEYALVQITDQVQRAPKSSWMLAKKLIILVGLSRWKELVPLTKDIKNSNIPEVVKASIIDRLVLLHKVDSEPRIVELIESLEPTSQWKNSKTGTGRISPE